MSRFRPTTRSVVLLTALGGATIVVQASSTAWQANEPTAQSSPAQAARPGFTVASIRRTPNPTQGQGGPYFMPGGRFRATGVTLTLLMRIAYSYDRGGPLLPYQIAGGPSWMNTDRFDIDAVAETGPSDPLALLRLQRLLEERFSLRVHEETRDAPVYDLIRASSTRQLGPQLRPSTAECPPPGGPPPPATERCGLDIAIGRMSGRGVQLAYLALVLSGLGPIERHVRDQTGLSGQFDLDLTWSPDTLDTRAAQRESGTVESDSPSIFTAIEEQFGLRLEPARAPIDILVIDRVEQPTEN